MHAVTVTAIKAIVHSTCNGQRHTTPYMQRTWVRPLEGSVPELCKAHRCASKESIYQPNVSLSGAMACVPGGCVPFAVARTLVPHPPCYGAPALTLTSHLLLGPSSPQFHELLCCSPSRLSSPLASLCLAL